MSSSSTGEGKPSNDRKRKLDSELSTKPSTVQGLEGPTKLAELQKGFLTARNADYRMFYLHATTLKETLEYSQAGDWQKEGMITNLWLQIINSRNRKGLSCLAYCRRHNLNPAAEALMQPSFDDGKSARTYSDDKTVLSKTGTHNGDGFSAPNGGPTSTQLKGTLVATGEMSKSSISARTTLPSSHSNTSKEPETLASSSQNNPSQLLPQSKNNVSLEASKRNVSTTAMLKVATEQDRRFHHQNASVHQNQRAGTTITDDLRREMADLRRQMAQDMRESQVSLDALAKMMEHHSERLDAIEKFIGGQSFGANIPKKAS